MSYAVENAIFLWEEGEQRIREAEDARRRRLERATDVIVDELRRRLGSTYTLSELAQRYAEGTDWASDLAQQSDAGSDAVSVVGAAFARYARGAADYAGSFGRR